MIRKSILGLWLLMSVTLCLAQDDKTKSGAKPRPDLSGNWTLDRSKSDFGRFEGSAIAKADVMMTITWTDPEFRVMRKMNLKGEDHSGDWLFYTDGRGETNPALLGGTKDLKTKTKWSGSKLVSKASYSRSYTGEDTNVDIEEKWELSTDGKMLTNSFAVSSTDGTQVVKLVYARAP
jgi:hypothetical protein